MDVEERCKQLELPQMYKSKGEINDEGISE